MLSWNLENFWLALQAFSSSTMSASSSVFILSGDHGSAKFNWIARIDRIYRCRARCLRDIQNWFGSLRSNRDSRDKNGSEKISNIRRSKIGSGGSGRNIGANRYRTKVFSSKLKRKFFFQIVEGIWPVWWRPRAECLFSHHNAWPHARGGPKRAHARKNKGPPDRTSTNPTRLQRCRRRDLQFLYFHQMPQYGHHFYSFFTLINIMTTIFA